MEGEELSSEQVLEALNAIAVALEASNTETPQAFWEAGQVSIGAVVGSVIGFLIGFVIRRYYSKKDEQAAELVQRRKTAMELNDRFNSKEVIACRRAAEGYLLTNPGKPLDDIRSDDDAYAALWILAREYELLAVSIEEGVVDESLTTKFFAEIFGYWLQHFSFIFGGQDFQLVTRLKFLDDFFRKRLGHEEWTSIIDKQRRHINDQMKRNERPPLDFNAMPSL